MASAERTIEQWATRWRAGGAFPAGAEIIYQSDADRHYYVAWQRNVVTTDYVNISRAARLSPSGC